MIGSIDLAPPPAIYSSFEFSEDSHVNFSVAENPVERDDWSFGNDPYPQMVIIYRDPPYQNFEQRRYMNYTEDKSQLSEEVVFYMVEVDYTEIADNDFCVDYDNGLVTWTMDMLRFYWVQYIDPDNSSDYFVLFYSLGLDDTFYPARATFGPYTGCYAICDSTYITGFEPLPDIVSPDSSDGAFSYLYNLGRSLFDFGLSFESILDFKIGGSTFISLLFTSGFLIYMGWCVVKWFLPI